MTSGGKAPRFDRVQRRPKGLLHPNHSKYRASSPARRRRSEYSIQYGFEEALADDLDDTGVGTIGDGTGVDEGYTVRFTGRNLKILFAHAGEEGAAFGLKTVLVRSRFLCFLLLIPAAGTVDAGRNIGVHKYGEIGLKATAEHAMEGENGLAAQTTSAALVGLRGIREAVAQDPCTAFECGKDVLLDLLRTGGEHEGHFGEWRKSVSTRVEHNGANAIADGRSAGLPRGDHIEVFFPEHFQKTLHLSAFTAPVETFEGDELATFTGSHRVILASGNYGSKTE